jgi:hypothetical protein
MKLGTFFPHPQSGWECENYWNNVIPVFIPICWVKRFQLNISVCPGDPMTRIFSFECRFSFHFHQTFKRQSRRWWMRRTYRGFHRRIWQDCQEIAKVRHNLSKIQIEGKNQKKTNFVHFSKGCVFFLSLPTKDGREVGETVGSMSVEGWSYQEQGGYDLVGHDPHYRKERSFL